MGEIIHLSRERIQITIYTRHMAWGWLSASCRLESDRTLAAVQAVVKELGQWYFEVRARPWITHFYEAVPRGGWWSPVVMVGRTVFSQGAVPDRAKLRAYLNEQIHILRPRLAKSS